MHGIEPWKTNGPVSSTVQVDDLNTSGDSNPDYLKPLPEVLLFSATENSVDRELWGIDLRNNAPSSDGGGPYSGSEGVGVSLEGLTTDPDDDILYVTWEAASSLCTISNSYSLTAIISCADDGEYSATLTVYDWWHVSSSNLVTVSLQNLSPTLNNFTVFPIPPLSSIPLTISASYDDSGSNDTHTAIVDWGDSNMDSAAIDPLSRTVRAGHTYSLPGLYTVTIRLTDDDGGEIIEMYTLEVKGAVYLPLIRK